MSRTGATREHYLRQKGQCYAYFRANPEDIGRMAASQFTIYDFITNAFSFSPTKKEASVAVLMALRERPRTFTQLLEATGVKKSTLYLLCLSLQRSGLITRPGGRDSPFTLSQEFCRTLSAYAEWWAKWLSAKEGA
ncbi:MAG: helix-turn-helix domain-containing protein [Candidatus Micrarchaeota archaeon]